MRKNLKIGVACICALLLLAGCGKITHHHARHYSHVYTSSYDRSYNSAQDSPTPKESKVIKTNLVLKHGSIAHQKARGFATENRKIHRYTQQVRKQHPNWKHYMTNAQDRNISSQHKGHHIVTHFYIAEKIVFYKKG